MHMHVLFSRSLRAALVIGVVAALDACGGGANTAGAPPLGSAVIPGSNAAARVSLGLVTSTGEPETAGCPVLSVASARARCYVHVGARHSSGFAAPNTPGFYSPAQLQAAYELPSSTKGVGESVFIVDAYDDPNVEADLGVYRSNYGLSACTTANGCFRKLNESGQAGPYPTGDMGWGQEISLDTQMVSAICPECKIVLIEANSDSSSDLYASVDEAVKLKAKIISTSWGNGEYNGETSSDVYFDHPGVMITNSSGDGGYAGGTQYPAASPYVTAVGGTALVPANNTRGWTESAWSGSGSGCSQYEAKPTWQTDTGCTNRTIADVAAVADSVAGYDSYESGGGGWYSFYGTSVSSPIVASVYALAENPGKLTFGSHSYTETAHLHDMTKGSTGTCSPTYLCTAGPGYDGPTGNGTPHGTGAF